MGVVGVDSALVEGWSSKFRGRLGSRFGSGWILWPVSPDPSWVARRSQRGRQAVPFLGRATNPTCGVDVPGSSPVGAGQQFQLGVDSAFRLFGGFDPAGVEHTVGWGEVDQQ